jgi:hypothetical protein
LLQKSMVEFTFFIFTVNRDQILKMRNVTSLRRNTAIRVTRFSPVFNIDKLLRFDTIS